MDLELFHIFSVVMFRSISVRCVQIPDYRAEKKLNIYFIEDFNI